MTADKYDDVLLPFLSLMRKLSFTPGRWAHIVGAHVAQRLAPKDGVDLPVGGKR